MELRKATVKKFKALFSSLPEDLEQCKIPPAGSDISSADFMNLWKLAELSTLLSNWYSLYTTEVKLSKSEIVKKLKAKGHKPSEYTVMVIYNKPKIIQISLYDRPIGSNQQKFLTDYYTKDTIYYFPHLDYFLARDLDNEIAEEIFDGFSQRRLRSMDLSKVYNSDNVITYLAVKAVHEISGFHGLEQIIFDGDNVKMGIYGLHKRQDIRVNIDQIGPRVAVSTKDFDLKIGSLLRIKTISGLSEIQRII